VRRHFEGKEWRDKTLDCVYVSKAHIMLFNYLAIEILHLTSGPTSHKLQPVFNSKTHKVM